ncbi:MAG: SPOR domain-containing protein [Parvibaculum sp.]
MHKAGSGICLLLTLAALVVVSLAGCASHASPTGTSSSTAVFPAAIPEKPVDYTRLGTSQETVEARLDRLEKNIADLRINYSSIEPAVKELATRNQAQEQRLAAVEQAFGPMTASIRATDPLPAMQAPATTTVMPPQEHMKPIADLSDLRGVSHAQAQAISPTGWGVHLASYHTLAAAEKGWQELQLRFPDLLAGQHLITRPFDGGAKGQFQRVLAGPYADKASAGKLCAAFGKRATWCEVLPLSTATPSVATR